MPKPRFSFSLRSGAICFLVVSAFLGLQFPEHFRAPDVYRGWPAAITLTEASFFHKPENWTAEEFRTHLATLYPTRPQMRYVDEGNQTLVVYNASSLKATGVLINAACAIVTALFCTRLAAWIADRKRKVPADTQTQAQPSAP